MKSAADERGSERSGKKTRQECGPHRDDDAFLFWSNPRLSAFIRGEFLRQSPIRNLTGIMVAVQSFAERKFPSNRGLQLVSMQTWFITLVLERCISVPSSHP